ncbi:pyridoxamine 5'-phosphate oxidase family protein [Streptomyces sclerotialus]|uniref:pyridoxamine 5'-phosphate oxidase family protein n=1 Tax=Streptomyces sclerotialus TaxID=1957 RepID=UPI000A7FA969
MLTLHRTPTGFGTLPTAPFDVAAFLARPLVARLATFGSGPLSPVLQPVWYLWEQDAFWVITGSWARLGRRLAADPRFSLVVDICEQDTGTVQQVTAYGRGSLTDFDTTRGLRKLRRYLGRNVEQWDARFTMSHGQAERGTRWARLVPDVLRVADLSFRPASELSR